MQLNWRLVNDGSLVRIFYSDSILNAVKDNVFEGHVDNAEDKCLPEANTSIHATVIIDDNLIGSIVSKFSDWYKLKVKINWILWVKGSISK